MECLEAVLKSSFRKDMSLKLSPQAFPEDLNMQNVTACDDFFVDDLLDFSLLENEEPDQHKHNHHSTSVSPHNSNHDSYNCNPSFNDNFNTELTLPVLLPYPFRVANFFVPFFTKVVIFTGGGSCGLGMGISFHRRFFLQIFSFFPRNRLAEPR